MKRLLILALFDIFLLLCAVAAQEPVQAPTWGPQVTMIFAGAKNKQKYVVPQATVVFKLVPQSGPTVNAPLNFKDYMICRVATQHDTHERPYIVVKCGDDTYLLQGFDLIPPKEARGTGKARSTE